VSPPLVSCSTEPVRDQQLLRTAQDQTRSSLVPRSPLPSSLLNLPPSGEGAATSKAVIDEPTACIATSQPLVMTAAMAVLAAQGRTRGLAEAGRRRF
jgi:hypothetical protein